ncbi:MAG: Gldg family protein [Kofleriaceae bacterium]
MSAGALAVARYELATLRRSPAALGVAALFLVVQGLAFAAQVEVLADPRRPAPLGAVLQGYFAGSLLSWTVWIAVVVALAVRVLAEERRAGGWELLLSTPVGDGAAVVGKWLAVCAVQAALWVPTATYLLVLARYAPADASWDWGPVVGAYLGVAAVGAALAAVALAAAAGAGAPLAAGAIGFAVVLVIALVGEVATVWPELASARPMLRAALAAASLRDHVAAIARGEVTAVAVVVISTIAVVGLAAAVALVGRGRRRRPAVRRAMVSTALLAIVGCLAVVLVDRAAWRWDLTAAGEHRLDPATRTLLARLDEPATVTVVRPTLAAFEPVYAEIERVLARMHRAQPRLAVTHVDLAEGSPALATLAAEAGLAAGDLGRAGAVIVRRGGRQRVVELPALASFGRDVLAAPTITRLDVEAAVTSRLRELGGAPPWTVCVVGSDGAATLGASEQLDLRGWDQVGAALRADGAVVEPRAADADGLAGCAVAVVAGPRGGWSPAAARQLVEFVQAGGGALVALGPRLPGALAAALASLGITVDHAEVTDPAAALDDAGRFRVVDGYAAHPVNDGFARRRVTVWRAPWALAPGPGAVALVSTVGGAGGGPEVIAAAAEPGAGRLVVLGADELEPERAGGAGALWAVQALRYVARRERVEVLAQPAPPPVVRLQMTAGERRAVTALCVAGVPAAVVLLGDRCAGAVGGAPGARGDRDPRGRPRAGGGRRRAGDRGDRDDANRAADIAGAGAGPRAPVGARDPAGAPWRGDHRARARRRRLAGTRAGTGAGVAARGRGAARGPRRRALAAHRAGQPGRGCRAHRRGRRRAVRAGAGRRRRHRCALVASRRARVPGRRLGGDRGGSIAARAAPASTAAARARGGAGDRARRRRHPAGAARRRPRAGDRRGRDLRRPGEGRSAARDPRGPRGGLGAGRRRQRRDRRVDRGHPDDRRCAGHPEPPRGVPRAASRPARRRRRRRALRRHRRRRRCARRHRGADRAAGGVGLAAGDGGGALRAGVAERRHPASTRRELAGRAWRRRPPRR